MNRAKLYYTPPRQELFEAVKRRAMELWKEIDTDNETFGYATEKINQIKDIENVGDNFMYMVGTFDIHNQRLLANRLQQETREAIKERMIDGETPREYIVF